jgi:hypothetical protein
MHNQPMRWNLTFFEWFVFIKSFTNQSEVNV